MKTKTQIVKIVILAMGLHLNVYASWPGLFIGGQAGCVNTNQEIVNSFTVTHDVYYGFGQISFFYQDTNGNPTGYYDSAQGTWYYVLTSDYYPHFYYYAGNWDNASGHFLTSGIEYYYGNQSLEAFFPYRTAPLDPWYP